MSWPPDLTHEEYPRVRRRMLGYERDAPILRPSGTFPESAAAISSLGVELILFTTYSALPVAACMRAYYQTIGASTPEMDYVAVSWEKARLDERSYSYQDVVLTEGKRLARIARGMRIGIVDQYVNEGKTLDLATTIATESGGVVVYTTRTARWYEDARLDNPTAALSLRTEHDAFMTEVGIEAGRINMNPYRSGLRAGF